MGRSPQSAKGPPGSIAVWGQHSINDEKTGRQTMDVGRHTTFMNWQQRYGDDSAVYVTDRGSSFVIFRSPFCLGSWPCMYVRRSPTQCTISIRSRCTGGKGWTPT